MDKLQEALLAMEARLAEKLKLPTDVIRKDELDRLVKDLVAQAHPVQPAGMVMPGGEAGMEKFAEFIATRLASYKQRPEAWTKAAPWTSDYGKKFKSMPGFLRACVKKSPDLETIDLEAGQKAASDGMTETTGSSGGNLVPTEFSYDVIRLLYAATWIRQKARLVPLSTWKRTLPRQSSTVTIAWVTEFGTKTVTKPAFGQVTQTAKVMAAIIKSSDELLRDSALNVQQFVAELIAEAMAIEEERVALAGDVSGAGDPFNGIIYASSVVEHAMADLGGLAYDDLIDLEGAIGEAYSAQAEFAMKRDALHVIMKLKDGNGAPIWHAPREGNPALILNRPYSLSAHLPTNLGATADMTPIILGDFKRLWVSDREGMAVKVSQDASDWVSGALDSAFMTDQTWLRFTRALSIDVMLPQAFAFMNVK